MKIRKSVFTVVAMLVLVAMMFTAGCTSQSGKTSAKIFGTDSNGNFAVVSLENDGVQGALGPKAKETNDKFNETLVKKGQQKIVNTAVKQRNVEELNKVEDRIMSQVF